MLSPPRAEEKPSSCSNWTPRRIFYKKFGVLQTVRYSSLVGARGSPIVFAFCLVASTLSVHSSEPEQSFGAIAQIQAVIQAQQEAWNRGDIDAFMNGYARSPSTIFVSEDKVTRGWDTVRDRYKKKYSNREKMGTLAFSDLENTPLGRNAAVVLGHWKLKRAEDQPHGRFTLIFRLTKDGWRIVHDHTSAAPPKQ